MRWIDETMKDAWECIRKNTLDYNGNYMQRQKIKSRAVERIVPLATKPKADSSHTD